MKRNEVDGGRKMNEAEVCMPHECWVVGVCSMLVCVHVCLLVCIDVKSIFFSKHY